MAVIQANNNNDDEILKIKKRVKLQLIDDISSTKATFKKRCAGLLKKLEQIAILCDIQACIAIFCRYNFNFNLNLDLNCNKSFQPHSSKS
ncbi:hypothetical protein S83_015113 [Arachis hypogaea]